MSCVPVFVAFIGRYPPCLPHDNIWLPESIFQSFCTTEHQYLHRRVKTQVLSCHSTLPPTGFVFCFVFYNLIKFILCVLKNSTRRDQMFCICLNESKKYFQRFLNDLHAFGILLFFKWHHDSNFLYKTNGKIWDHHLKLSLVLKINPTWP